MKKASLLLMVMILFFLSYTAEAHPGRTDSSGGHTCRTNCGKWGLSTGEYHYHNGGGLSSSDDDVSSDEVSDDNVSSESTQAQLEEHYDDLVQEGHYLGYKHGYNELSYLDFHSDQFGQLSMAEYSWYKAGYEKGYEEGKAIRIEELKKSSKKEGYMYGLSNEEIWIPDLYLGIESVKEAYEIGFQEGRAEAVEKIERASEEKGYKSGYNLIPFAIPEDLPKVFVDSFKKGYTNGYEDKKEDAFQEGYTTHFKLVEYNPNTYSDYPDIQQAYKEGFDSNTEADNYRKIAFETGSKNKSLFLPDEIRGNEDIVELFNTYYQKGKDEWNKKIKFSFSLIILAALTLIISGYFFYRRRKNSSL